MPSSSRDDEPRLNLFAFPSETGGRFLLLILSGTAAALFAYNWVYFGITNSAHDAAISLRCAAEAGPVGAGAGNTAAYAARSSRFSDCITQVTHPKGLFMLACLAALFLLATALYLATPWWKLRRGGWRPLDPADAPAVVDELARLAHASDLRREPRFVWNPLDPAATALAFGRPRRHYVALRGGLVLMYFTDPEFFRSVVLHELAHLRNRDVDRTYFTMAFWYAFVIAALVPLAIALSDDSSDVILSVAWRMAVLSGLVYLTRNGVLRTREMYADARAEASGASGLHRVLAAMTNVPRRPVLTVLRLHPDPRTRADALSDPDRLLKRLSIPAAFATGIVFPLVFRELTMLIGFYDTNPMTVNWLAALGIAPFVVAVMWLAVWRAAQVAVVRGVRPAGVSAAGLALGAGALIGEAISFQDIGVVSGDLTGIVGLASRLTGIGISHAILSSYLFGWGVLWAVGLIVSMVLLVRWMTSSALLWLRHGGERAPRIAAWCGLATSAAVLTVWTGVFFLLHDYGAPVSRIIGPSTRADAAQIAAAFWIGPFTVFRFVADPIVQYVEARWPVLPAAVLVWLFPLAAGVAIDKARTAPRWLLGDARDRPRVAAPAVHIRRVLAIGGAVGIAAIIAMLALRAGVHAWVPVERRGFDEFVPAFYYWNVYASLAAQVLAAVLAAALCSHARVLHGLAAAFVAGVLADLALIFGQTVGSCLGPLSLHSGAKCPTFAGTAFTRQVFEQTLIKGALLAIAAGIAVTGIAAAQARLRRRNRPRPTPRAPAAWLHPRRWPGARPSKT